MREALTAGAAGLLLGQLVLVSGFTGYVGLRFFLVDYRGFDDGRFVCVGCGFVERSRIFASFPALEGEGGGGPPQVFMVPLESREDEAVACVIIYLLWALCRCALQRAWCFVCRKGASV